jgi:hypothetical protein
MKNLKRALLDLKNVQVYDNSDLMRPYELVAAIENGEGIKFYKPTPKWLRDLLP